MTNLSIKERTNGSVMILDLKGRLRLGEGCTELHQSLRSLVERGEKKILLNLEGLSHIDSSGLGELVSGYVSVKKNGGEVKLLHLTDNIYELMVLTKLLTIFDAYETEQEAVSRFDNPTVKASYVSRLV
jgi:anti-sigma B factor antagonist